MANLQSLLRQVLGFIRRNPSKANRHLRTVSETVKKRTGGRYDRHIDKATGAASKYLAKQSGRAGHGAPHDRDLRHRSEGSVPRYRPDGDDHGRRR
ncbi:antitoxin [Streptomonospora wellingtoniae]|uniref:Antitoxin n=1 Tax=Streptomonospora wellingtoniae TaxID=3075544 RepID=A0ABU2L126_9ACTN|nr:antitoxin [Streptomonospora sp. DSM 45055]MDT0305202.1 antitoxin [Streptomonospora sp. DSM 45055]